ncbi:HAD hydrolase-like protein [bacterium]|nr:HAD hydrolase-like protein [bacterium]
MKYKLVIFDLDGTLLNTLDDLAGALNHALKANAYPERSLREVCSFVGNGIRRLVERGVPAGTSSEAVDKVFASFHTYYKDHSADKTAPYEGVCELLKLLRGRGLLLAVVSNKADYAVQYLCDYFFPGLINICVGEREGMRRKPFPDLTEYVMDSLEVKREESVYIGDSEVDLQTAVNAGTDCISVSWGFKTEDFLRRNGASVIVSSPESLGKYLLSL